MTAFFAFKVKPDYSCYQEHLDFSSFQNPSRWEFTLSLSKGYLFFPPQNAFSKKRMPLQPGLKQRAGSLFENQIEAHLKINCSFKYL